MVRVVQPLIVALACASIAVLAAAGGCGSKSSGSNFDNPSSSSSGASSGSTGGSSGDDGSSPSSSSGSGASSGFNLPDTGSATPTCAGGATGWKCKVDTSCKTATSLTGKVFDPAGANPLYNVVVFIPNDVSTLPVITPGTHTCNTCDVSIGDYVSATQTKSDGSFTLSPVPNAKQVPITVQIGKWRRTTYVDIDNDCASNSVGNGVLHLPGKRADGDMPQMAVLTGGCDDLGCFMTGMGIDPTEFSAPMATLNATAPHTGGRLDVYEGTGLGGITNGATLSTGTAGNCTGANCPLWASTSSLEYYDMVLLSCECGENNQTKSQTSLAAMRSWLDEGGKVFASHYQYTWFKNSPSADFQGVANWVTSGAADPATVTEDIDTTFPKGLVFGQWLQGVGALASAGNPPTVAPTISLTDVATSVSTVNSTPPQNTVRWIYDPPGTGDGAGPDVKYMSFGTPIGGTPAAPDAGESGPQYCGKAVFTDLHTSGELLSTVTDIPSGCNSNAGKLSAQQKALEFLFFDLSACVTNDKIIPPGVPNPPQ
jgi:hypothetical protein